MFTNTNVVTMRKLEKELEEVEGPDEVPVRDKTPLVCREAHRQVLAEAANLKFFKKTIQIVGAADLLFILASFAVITQFVLGDAPQSDINRIVFVTPIVGTLLASGAVLFLVRQSRAAARELERLSKTFRRVCKDVNVD